MATPAQSRPGSKALIARIQNSSGSNSTCLRSASDAAADRRDARQPFTSPRTVELVSRTRRGRTPSWTGSPSPRTWATLRRRVPQARRGGRRRLSRPAHTEFTPRPSRSSPAFVDDVTADDARLHRHRSGHGPLAPRGRRLRAAQQRLAALRSSQSGPAPLSAGPAHRQDSAPGRRSVIRVSRGRAGAATELRTVGRSMRSRTKRPGPPARRSYDVNAAVIRLPASAPAPVPEPGRSRPRRRRRSPRRNAAVPPRDRVVVDRHAALLRRDEVDARPRCPSARDGRDPAEAAARRP